MRPHRGKNIAKRFLDYALKCAATKRHTIVAAVAVQDTRDIWQHLGFEPFSGPEELLNKIRKSYGDDACYIIRCVA
jgi:GNAT superfamily N-acetyltransferase